MREIKFRYGFKKNKYIFHIFDLIDIETGLFEAWRRVNFISPEQIIKDEYIGLKDKTGKEIYEGDIARWNDGSGIYEIVFKNGAFMRFSKFKCYYSHINNDSGDLEIIGNIHENPELLEATI